MNHDERRRWLIEQLLDESSEYRGMSVPEDPEEQFRLFRGLCNVRMPDPVSKEFLEVQDAFLQEENARRGITDAASLTPSSLDPRIFLWKGDITTIRCDAIVNAANSQMLGCFHPCHACIDNCIHTYSGIQLRLACNELMKAQGHEEETGTAKITPAFNLPSKYVLHTVGPIVGSRVTEKDIRLLRSCYRSCLELAVRNGCRSIAFCCISTGVFHFPQDQAAEIAVETVREFLASDDSIRQVIFNVFGEKDRVIYERLLEADDVL